MGASGAGIFDDDVACDVRAFLHDAYGDGDDAEGATDTVLAQMEDELEDEEDSPVIIFALAAAQWQAGRLDNRMKTRAIKLIDEGVDFRWVDSEYANERLGILQELKRKLESTPPAPVPIDELDS